MCATVRSLAAVQLLINTCKLADASLAYRDVAECQWTILNAAARIVVTHCFYPFFQVFALVSIIGFPTGPWISSTPESLPCLHLAVPLLLEDGCSVDDVTAGYQSCKAPQNFVHFRLQPHSVD